MYYFRWTVTILFWLLVGGFLHYTLPNHDIVRVVNTEVRRVDFGENSIFWANPGVGDAEATVDRDVFFIDTIRENGRPRVYRNEDTGWGWPPYFKLDSSNLQAEASDVVSSSEDPKWVSVRHYGWRIELLSVFPNAVAIKPVPGPDYRVINWFNIIFLTVLGFVVIGLWRRWNRFREARIDPVVEDLTDNLEAAGDAVQEKSGRFRRWLNSWRS